MTRVEKPLFRDGLSAEFEHAQQEPYAPKLEEWQRITVNPNLTVLQREYPGVGRYYIDLRGRLIAHLAQDHEAGIDVARWNIDHNDTEPLFVIRMSSERKRRPLLEVGFRSRGVKPETKIPGMIFPQLTAKYKFLGERLQFDTMVSGITGTVQRSLTTGEVVEVTTQEEQELVVLSSKLASGAVEEIRLPQSVDFMWLSTVNNSRTIYDSGLPFLQWPVLIGAQFTLNRPEVVQP